MIRRSSHGRSASHMRTVVLLVLASLLVSGCGQEAETDAPDARKPSMTEADYVTHVAALTIAVEEGRTGQDAYARAVELGSKGYSREDVEEFATLLRARPRRWVEIEHEVDTRINELREEISGRTDAGGENVR